MGELGQEPPKTEERHGHPEFYRLIDEIAKLHSDKNHDYATGGDPLGNFKRVAKFFEMYPDLDLFDPTVVAIVYAMKQLDAVLWFKSNKHQAKVEGIEPRLIDDAVYKLISVVLEREKGKKEEGKKETTTEDSAISPCKPGHSKPVLNSTESLALSWFWVFCPTCRLRGPKEKTMLSAIKRWNQGFRYDENGHRDKTGIDPKYSK